MFVNLEVGCHDPKDDPKVQLAVRITGAFQKRAEERYGRNMQVLAVAGYGVIGGLGLRASLARRRNRRWRQWFGSFTFFTGD